MKRRYIFIVFFLCSIISFSLKAQDAHYWSSNFSAAGFIAPGATIINNLDSGVYFINPALMAWSSKTATSISANVYSYDRIRIKNGIGIGKDLKSTGTKIIPQLISKTFKLNKDHPLTIGFALIQNPMQDARSSQRMDKKINVLDDKYSPGAETYVGQYDQNSKVTETYAQLSAGMRLNNKVAVGITLEGNLREHEVGSNLSSKAIFNSTSGNPDDIFPKVAASDVYFQNKYTHAGLRLKLGASYDSAPHHLGLLISTPQLKLYGRGSVLADISISNLLLPETNTELNLLASTRQTKLKANWRTPLSIAAGYGYDYGKGQISLTAEFFTGLKDYIILKPDEALFLKTGASSPAISSLSGDLDLTDERSSILNFGAGFTRGLSPTVILMLALRTDFNYLKTKDSEQGHLDLWDNYHFQFGANFKRRKFNLRAGMQLSYGRTKNYSQPANFDTPTESNLLLGETGQVPAKHFGAALLLSYIHNF